MISQDDIDAMSGPHLIGLTGKAGSGKSTAANILVAAGWHRIKMADPLKDMLRAIGLTDRHIEGDLKEVPCAILRGKTPRHAMQTLGTEWGREIIDDQLWTSLAKAKIARALASGMSVVVDDIRFDNEAEVIRDLGGVVILLNRSEGHKMRHKSENLVSADMTFDNTGTVADLRNWMTYVFLMSGIYE